MSWALVAGASQGIGACFARALAARGHDLILVARREAVLEALAQQLREKHGHQVVAAAVDLGAPGLTAQIAKLLEGRELELCVYNAAIAPVGPFSKQPLAARLAAVDVNCRGVVELLDVVLPGMVERRRGAVILMSSLTAYQGTPYTAVYGATKAFNLTLAEALWAELRGTGVEVLACCAGATRTEAYLKAMPQGAPGELEPEAVVHEALAAIGRGPSVVPGFVNKLSSLVLRRLLPRRWAVNLLGSRTKNLVG